MTKSPTFGCELITHLSDVDNIFSIKAGAYFLSVIIR